MAGRWVGAVGHNQRQRQAVTSTAFTYQVSGKVLKWSSRTTNSTAASHTYTLLTLEEEKYFPNMSSDTDRMAIRHNWDMLMPREYFTLSNL
jgi:hypothetical protein